MARADLGPSKVAYVLPITHTPPAAAEARRTMEVPPRIKRHLGLDDQPSWIVLDELNIFAWPGFDLRPVPLCNPVTCEYGILPGTFFRAVRQRMLEFAAGNTIRGVKRGEGR